MDKMRQRSSSPKFQVHNNALVSAQKVVGFSEIKKEPEKWGRMVESAIGKYLLNQSIARNFNLFYWREGNDEVDSVLQKENKVVALKLKGGVSQRNKGMESFKRKYAEAKVYLMGQNALGWKDFLKMEVSDLF